MPCRVVADNIGSYLIMSALPTTSGAAMLDVADVANLLKCSRRHVYRMSDAGKMPAPHKLGALVRWDHAALSRWIADGCPPVRRVGRAAK